jgi:hypothetical protein
MDERTSAAQDRWGEIIRRQSASGLSVAEFCRRQRVPASSFFLWKRRLGASAGAFVEAKVAGDGGAAMGRAAGGSSAVAATGAIELRLRGGRRVRVGRGFDRQLLAEVVAALEATS